MVYCVGKEDLRVSRNQGHGYGEILTSRTDWLRLDTRLEPLVELLPIEAQDLRQSSWVPVGSTYYLLAPKPAQKDGSQALMYVEVRGRRECERENEPVV
jgi:hypothetical protein